MIKIKNSGRYAMLVPTSIGLRLCPSNGGQVQSGGQFTLQATSAETNVASVSSYLGLPVKVLTAFVKGSPFAAFIQSDLRSSASGMTAQERSEGQCAWKILT